MLAPSDADAPVFSMPADVAAEACLVILTKTGAHIFHAGSPEDAEYVHVHVCMHMLYVCMSVYECVSVCVYVCVRVCVYICTSV